MTGGSVLVVTTDPLTPSMPGPAIRALNLAEVLARHHQVTLVTSEACERSHPDLRVLHAEGDEIRRLVEQSSAVVGPGSFVRRYPWIESLDIPLAIDLYDPYHLENLEPDGTPVAEQAETVAHLCRVVTEDLRRGDFFFCASERQRDFWLGSLATVGRVNPYTYADDPALRRLVDIVPFGISPTRPVALTHGLRGGIDGIGPDDEVLLWAGGVYNWFDPLSLLVAVDSLRHERPGIRLVFLGMGHPNPEIPAMRVAAELRSEADRRGLTGVHVFFLEGWVPYERRADYLLDADIGVSTSPDHVESRFAFRTRVLDHLWAGLPSLLTAGDALAERVEAEGAGMVVPPGDPAAIAEGIRSLLDHPPAPGAISDLADRYRWDRVAGPLVEWCATPRTAPDRAVERKDTAHPARDVAPPAPTDPGVPAGEGERRGVARVLSRLRGSG